MDYSNNLVRTSQKHIILKQSHISVVDPAYYGGVYMIKNYIIDTNVLVHDPYCISNFQDNNVIIPIMVVEELDNLKKKEGMLGFHARSAAREISMLRKYGNLNDGVRLPNGGTFRIVMNRVEMPTLAVGLDMSKVDSQILALAKLIQQDNPDQPTILVTKDVYMAVKGDGLGITVQDYENDKIRVDSIYTGYTDLNLPSSDIERIYREGLNLPEQLDKTIYPNEFLHIKSSDNTSQETLAMYNGEKIVPLKYSNSSAWGLVPINREQKMAFELLMDNNIHFVTLSGGAGSGKTILSTAVALQKVIEEEIYRKIVFVKPVVPAGNDIGYLPGTEEEKLKPWMGSFYDAIDNLFSNRYRRKEKNSKTDSLGGKPAFTVDSFIEEYKQHGIIETKTFTYMRGRTISDSLVIVDEAQEITPHLAKLMLTRAGFGSKFVFLGDPTDSQIDNLLVDSRSNGLVYTIEKMKPYTITGHISLNKVERSPLAQIAEKCM